MEIRVNFNILFPIGSFWTLSRTLNRVIPKNEYKHKREARTTYKNLAISQELAYHLQYLGRTPSKIGSFYEYFAGISLLALLVFPLNIRPFLSIQVSITTVFRASSRTHI